MRYRMMALVAWIIGCAMWVLTGVLFGCVVDYISAATIIGLAVKLPLMVITGAGWFLSMLFVIGLPICALDGDL